MQDYYMPTMQDFYQPVTPDYYQPVIPDYYQPMSLDAIAAGDGHIGSAGIMYGPSDMPVGHLDDIGNLYDTWGTNVGWVDAYGTIRDPYLGNSVGTLGQDGTIHDFGGSIIRTPYY